MKLKRNNSQAFNDYNGTRYNPNKPYVILEKKLIHNNIAWPMSPKIPKKHH